MEPTLLIGSESMRRPTIPLRQKLSRVLVPAVILLSTFGTSALVAGFTTLRASKDTVERYVSVWEEEIARNLLLRGDTELFEKIRAQILDLASDVEVSGPQAHDRSNSGTCFGEQNLSVTLYGTPAGDLKVCRSPQKLAIRSLTSPTFAFGLLAGFIFVVWLTRRLNREESSRAITELAIRVAHDIRSPIMALKVAAKSGSNSIEDTKILIEAATKRISAIADELLERSRQPVPTAGRREVPPLVPLTSKKSIQTSIHELVREKKMTTPKAVLFEVPEPRTVTGLPPAESSNDFERVVSNLLQNAIEATLAKTDPHTNPRIVVDTIESDKEISITICDNGIGIPKDVLPRIGEVGFSYGKSKGNGVGLSSARRWAQERGGNLDIRSLEGTGTEVRLTLPRLQSPIGPR